MCRKLWALIAISLICNRVSSINRLLISFEIFSGHNIQIFEANYVVIAHPVLPLLAFVSVRNKQEVKITTNYSNFLQLNSKLGCIENRVSSKTKNNCESATIQSHLNHCFDSDNSIVSSSMEMSFTHSFSREKCSKSTVICE